MTRRDCRICGSTDNTEVHVASEKMFGFGGSFAYFRCSACGCLQIEDPRIDVSRFYPQSYYSFASTASPHAAGWLARCRDNSAVFPGGLFGRALLALKPHAPLQSLGHLTLTRDTRIADVGCGAGHLLHALRHIGFTRLTGIDPNIPQDIDVDRYLCIRKAQIEELVDEFDVIMFHHSLEHILDQLATLVAARNRLAEHGTCVVRVPLVSSRAWEMFGTDWVQLDAPRHLYLHSLQSMRVLAERSGLWIERVLYDSSEFQFWGSDAIRRGVTLFDPHTGRQNPVARKLARRAKITLRRRAMELNRRGEGDQAIFLLRHRTSHDQASA
jgi:SAM-dependent methyltransferase